MSAKVKRPSNNGRNFKFTLHQSLVITDINFKKQVIRGNTELTILPTTPTNKLWKIPLNCKQCRILQITINGSRKPANFNYIDPSLCICPPDTKKRNLEYYSTCLSDAVKSCDYDHNGGELLIKVPRDAYDIVASYDTTPIKVLIEFSLEQPVGGVQFVQTTPDNSPHAHVYSYGWINSARLWFPCVDSYNELCHWSLSYTIPVSMIAISCGDLSDQIISADGRKKTFHYNVKVPTSAPLIGFAIGHFEIYPDPVMPEVTYFCLPQLLPILKNTVQFVPEVFGFYEELLSTGFPHSSYKLVFVSDSYQDSQNYAGLTLYNTTLLHSHRIIDQVPFTRRIIALSIAQQYFQCYLLPQSWSDWWLPVGISHFISGLFGRKMFGSTEYQYWIMTEQQRVCKYECNNSLPPLCEVLTESDQESPLTSFNPNLCSEEVLSILASKGHLVIRMLQLKIGHDLLVQVFNKLLTLASVASTNTDYSQWHNLLLSTGGFLKLVLTVSGKDLTHFLEQWVGHSGIAVFNVSHIYVRKKNMLELRLSQDPPRGLNKFVGPMNVVVQEFDGCFTHTIQVEETITSYELPCHSKIRKAKKRKMTLSHGEEIEINVSSLDAEVPVMWVRVDPEMQWLRQLNPVQSDTTWINLLQFERDAIGQLQAVEALKQFPSQSSLNALKDAVLNTGYYYRVRIKASEILAHVVSELISSGDLPSPDVLIRLYRQLYCVSQYPQMTLVKSHDFSDIANYLLHQALVVHIASVRNSHAHCPREILPLLLDIIKYSDNQSNEYSDSYYRASLITALSTYVTPPVAVLQSTESEFSLSSLQQDIKSVLQEIVKCLNIDKVLPTYKFTVTTSCLKALRVLQRMGHIPSNSSLFKEYNKPGQYIDVRIEAIQIIADIVQADQNDTELNYLLDIVEDPHELPHIKLSVLQCLASKPPFTRKSESTINTTLLVERLWTLINSKFSSDVRLRQSAIDLYEALYGRLTPTCLSQGLGVVIDLKERVARSSLPVVSPQPEDPLVDMETMPTAQPATIPHPLRITLTTSEETTVTSTPLQQSSKLIPVKLKLHSPSVSRDATPNSGDDVSPRPKKHKADHKLKKKHKHKHKHKHQKRT